MDWQKILNAQMRSRWGDIEVFDDELETILVRGIKKEKASLVGLNFTVRSTRSTPIRRILPKNKSIVARFAHRQVGSDTARGARSDDRTTEGSTTTCSFFTAIYWYNRLP
jgi:hypothetical protein